MQRLRGVWLVMVALGLALANEAGAQLRPLNSGNGSGGGLSGTVTGAYGFAYPLVLSGTSVTATATITNNDSRALQTLGSGFTNRNTNARLVAESSGGGSANVQIADPDFFGLFSTAQLGLYWTNTAGQLFFYGSSDAGNTVANVATFSPTNIFFNTNVYVGTLDAADRLVRYGELAAAGAGNLHSNAVTYANSLGLTNRAAIERVSKFFWTLQDGGLLSGSGTRFYDSIFLKGGMNSEASLAARYSFLGKLGTNWSTPVQTDGGMTVGSGGYDFAIDDVSTNFSVIFFGQTGTTGQLASSHIFSLTSSSGATNQGISIGHNGVNSTIVTKTAADGSAFANNYFGHLYTDYLMADYGFPFSAGFGYVRSGGLITNYMNGYVITNSANNPTLNDLSVLTFGGRLATLAPGWEGFWNGTAEGALIFTGQLSTNQLIFVDRAIRHLRPGNIDRLVIGDSTSANIYTKQTESWAYQWMTGPGTNEGMTRIFAMSGRRLDSMDDLFDDTAGRWGPHLTGNRTIINLWGGINDFYNSRTAQQAWQEVTNIVRKARASRIEVEIGTLYPSVIWDATQETHRQNFNGLILSNANLFTKIYRRDAMFSVTNGPLWYDFLHLSTNGNALVVEDMRRGGELGWMLGASTNRVTLLSADGGLRIGTNASPSIYTNLQFVTSANTTVSNAGNGTAAIHINATSGSASTNGTAVIATGNLISSNYFGLGYTNLGTGAVQIATAMGPQVIRSFINGDTTLVITNLTTWTNTGFYGRLRVEVVHSTGNVTLASDVAINFGRPFFVAQGDTNFMTIESFGDGRVIGTLSHEPAEVNTAYASVVEIDQAVGQAVVWNITNRVTGNLSLILTNPVSSRHLKINVIGEATSGTDRTVTLIPHTGSFVVNRENTTARTNSYQFTLQDGYAANIELDTTRLSGTNLWLVTVNEYAYGAAIASSETASGTFDGFPDYRRSIITIGQSSTTPQSLGENATVITTGTVRAPSPTNTVGLALATGAAVGNSNAIYGLNLSHPVGLSLTNAGSMEIFGSTNATRLWLGLADTTPQNLMATELPTSRNAALLRLTETNSNWWFVTCNGSACEQKDTGVAAVDYQRLKYILIEQNLGGSTNWMAFINGAPVATNSTTIPRATMRWLQAVVTLDAAAKTNVFEQTEIITRVP